ncbi:SDR family NAD(P)-dependent oxidoreductase [Actinophytocola glycyrrhizae]|uniref:SDR family NAD(P)-dependent oxidoreductase n=1 Tax=Actinophytocola glycyrrhizae TaxID=2044873 RepID=A0ABV9S518_9PSEU
MGPDPGPRAVDPPRARSTGVTLGRPLRGRTALITGGSRGIGAATAQTLAAMGASVVVTYRDSRTAAEKLAARLRAEHDVVAHAAMFDLSASEQEPAGVGELLQSVRNITGRIDVVVANAAAPYPKVPLMELSAEDLSRKIAQDIGITHRLVTSVAPGMLERGYGRIVLIGSLHAKGPSAIGMTANGVTRAALAAYVAYAADELTGPGVTVNTIHPGYIATDASSHLPAAITRVLEALTPAGRMGVSGDVAGAVAMLTREEATFVNGVCIPVSGGLNHPVSFRRLVSHTAFVARSSPRSGTCSLTTSPTMTSAPTTSTTSPARSSTKHNAPADSSPS